MTPAKFGDFLKQVFHRGDLGDASSMDGSLGKYIITVVTVNISGVPCTVIVSGYFTGQWSARILVWKRGLSQHDHLRPISLCPVANTMRRNHRCRHSLESGTANCGGLGHSSPHNPKHFAIAVCKLWTNFIVYFCSSIVFPSHTMHKNQCHSANIACCSLFPTKHN